MNNRFGPDAVLRPVLALAALSLLCGCNTATTPVRSGGSPGASAAGGPSVTVGSPGASSGGGATATISGPGLPSPATAGMPTPGASGADAMREGTTARPPIPGRMTPTGGPDSAGLRTGGETGGGEPNRSDDEILAEALEALRDRPAATASAPDKSGGSAAAVARPPTPAATDAAATGGGHNKRLEQALESEFAEFDRIILGEQEAIDARAKEAGYGGAAGADAAMPAPDSGQQTEPPLQTALLDTEPANIEPGTRAGTRDHSRVPPDLTDASGDDIIARQLREAAMKEADPELRKKLWVEYRKYKREMR